MSHEHRVPAVPPNPTEVRGGRVVEPLKSVRRATPDRLGQLIVFDERGQRSDGAVVLQMRQRLDRLLSVSFRRRGCPDLVEERERPAPVLRLADLFVVDGD